MCVSVYVISQVDEATVQSERADQRDPKEGGRNRGSEKTNRHFKAGQKEARESYQWGTLLWVIGAM